MVKFHNVMHQSSESHVKPKFSLKVLVKNINIYVNMYHMDVALHWALKLNVSLLPLPDLPEDEDEEHQQHAEGGHVVHGLHQNHQLSLQSRHEANQLQNPHQSEGPQHRQTPALLTHDLPHTEGGNQGGIKSINVLHFHFTQWCGGNS